MSDPTNIFSGSPQETPANSNNDGSNVVNASTSNNALEDLLKGIRNERGEQKYRTVEDALKGLAHAQEYIPQLKGKLSEQEQKLQELSQKVEGIGSLEDTVSKLLEQSSTSNQPAMIDESKIAELINKTLTQKQQNELQQANVNNVVTIVQETFGDKAEEAFYGRGAELGMSREEMNALAARSPKAVLTMLGIERKEQKVNHTPSSSSINTEGFKPSQESFIGRNNKSTLLGATTSEVIEEQRNANKMLEELAAKGVSLDALTNPKLYKQHFRK